MFEEDGGACSSSLERVGRLLVLFQCGEAVGADLGSPARQQVVQEMPETGEGGDCGGAEEGDV